MGNRYVKVNVIKVRLEIKKSGVSSCPNACRVDLVFLDIMIRLLIQPRGLSFVNAANSDCEASRVTKSFRKCVVGLLTLGLAACAASEFQIGDRYQSSDTLLFLYDTEQSMAAADKAEEIGDKDALDEISRPILVSGPAKFLVVDKGKNPKYVQLRVLECDDLQQQVGKKGWTSAQQIHRRNCEKLNAN